MPSVSKKQRRFMAAAAHNPRFAKKAGIKQSVAKDFNRADQGALKRAMGGAIRRVVGRAGAQAAGTSDSAPPKRGGALTRAIGRVAPQGQKNPRSRMMRNHMMTPDMMTGTDATLAETGEGLRKIIGRVGSRGRIAASHGGKIGRYAEGGKVGSAMAALRALAKKYQEALESGDTVLARRLKKQLDSAGVKDAEEEVGNQKAATFAKGGKVKGLRALSKAFRARMDDREGYVREGRGDTKEEAYENLRKKVARDNGEDVADAVLKEHGVTYKQASKPKAPDLDPDRFQRYKGFD